MCFAIKALTELIGSFGWSLIISMVMCQILLLVSCLVSFIYGDDKVTFNASGHIRAYLVTLAVCWIIVLLVRLITT